MYVWEHEFGVKDRVLDRLKLKLGIEIETVNFDFKDVIVREITTAEASAFLGLYHYIGGGRGGKTVGAFLGDELVAVVVFSPPLRQNGPFSDVKFVELSRSCIHPSYHKRNFASWFLSRAMRNIDCLVVSYADTTVGHTGSMYKAIGFELHHEVPADYWYVDVDGYVMHKKTLYNKAVNLKMTEAEFAEQKGYVKRFGGQKLCFVKYPSKPIIHQES